MKKILILFVLSLCITGCGGDITFDEPKEAEKKVTLPPNMTYEGYSLSEYGRRIICRKRRIGESTETHYVYRLNGELDLIIVEQ